MQNRFLYVLAISCVSYGLGANGVFACNPNSTDKKEIRICKTAELKKLNGELAKVFRDKYRKTKENRRAHLKDEHRLWGEYRRKCGRNLNCSITRTKARLTELSPKLAVLTGFILHSAETVAPTPTGDPYLVETRIEGNKLQKVYSNGMIKWHALNGGGYGTIHPDGTETLMSPLEAPRPDFPPLPNANQEFGTWLEGNLTGMLQIALKNDQYQEYLQQYGQGGFYDRVSNHLKAVSYFVSK